MTMPSDAAEVIESAGSNDGPREHDPNIDSTAYVDDENVPHPPGEKAE